MNVRLFSLSLLLSLGLALPAAAQAPDRGQLFEIATMSVSPADMGTFMEVVGMIKGAAEAADLPAEHGWQIWTSDFDVGIVSTVDNMAAFDDPEAFMRAISGTPGEEMMQDAMEKFQAEVWARSVSREVWELEADWSYAPAEPQIESTGYAEMLEFWLKPGMEEEFEAVVKDVMGFFAGMPGRYPINGFRPHFGDTGRAVFVVFHDGWGDYYGDHSLEQGLEATGTGGEWQALMERLSDCTIDMDTTLWTHVGDLSYGG
jgi:hypothetical protein